MPAAVRIKMDDETAPALTQLDKNLRKVADAADYAGKKSKGLGDQSKKTFQGDMQSGAASLDMLGDSLASFGRQAAPTSAALSGLGSGAGKLVGVFGQVSQASSAAIRDWDNLRGAAMGMVTTIGRFAAAHPGALAAMGALGGAMLLMQKNAEAATYSIDELGDVSIGVGKQVGSIADEVPRIQIAFKNLFNDPYLQNLGGEIAGALGGSGGKSWSEYVKERESDISLAFTQLIEGVNYYADELSGSMAAAFSAASGGSAEDIEAERKAGRERSANAAKQWQEEQRQREIANGRTLLEITNRQMGEQQAARDAAAALANRKTKEAVDARIAEVERERQAMVDAGKFGSITTGADGKPVATITPEAKKLNDELAALQAKRDQIEAASQEESKQRRAEYLAAQREQEERTAAEIESARDERNKRALESEEKLQKALEDLRAGKGDARSMVEQIDKRTEERRKDALRFRTESEQRAAEDAAESWRYQWLQAIDSVSNTRQMADAFQANVEAGKKAADEWKAKWAESVQSVAQMLRGGTEQGDVIERIRSQIQQQDPRQLAQQVAERRRQAAARQFTQEHADDYGVDTQSRSRFEADRRKFAEREARRGFSDVVHGRAKPEEIQATQNQAFAQTVQAMTAQGNLSPVLAQGLQEAARQAIVASQQAQQAEAMAKEALEALGRSKPANRGNRFGGR